MVPRVARRDALQLIVRTGAAPPLDEACLLECRADPVGVVADDVSECLDARLVHPPHAAADVHLPRLEMKIATVSGGPLVVPSACRRTRGRLDPWKGGAEVTLVRRLVLAEAGVATDAARRPIRIREHRDATCGQAFREG